MTTRHSSSTKPNRDVDDATQAQAGRPKLRFNSDSNVSFVLAALKRLQAEHGIGSRNLICLVGQQDLPGVTLRRAQAILRWDLRPSLWSHVFLIAEDVELTREAVTEAPIREVVLHSRTGAFPDPADNAVTWGRLGDYDDPRVDANIAVLSVEMDEEDARDVSERVTNPNLDRTRYDLWQTLGVWQSYFWSAGALENPLRQSVPMFSSAFIEYCFEAARLDLAPAASDRNSAPEHLWNAARWWYRELADAGHPIRGWYALRDKHCTLLDPEELRRTRAIGR